MRRQLLEAWNGIGEKLKRIDGSRRYRKKIRRLSKGLKTTRVLKSEERRIAIECLKGFHASYRNLRWHTALSSANGITSPYYVPEDIFYSVLERELNPRFRASLYRNKNLYERLGLVGTPQVIARIVRGRLLDEAFLPVATEEIVRRVPGEVVVKPALDSGLGRNIRFVGREEIEDVLRTLVSPKDAAADWIIEKPLEQCEELAMLNQSSVNTIRIMTMRVGTSIRHISSFLRMGRAQSRVDNYGAGGIGCGVDETGRLKEFGYDFFLRAYAAHPDSGQKFLGYQIPRYEDALNTCFEMHSRVPDMDLVSWDLAVDRSYEIRTIEMNTIGQGVLSHQVCNGPVFEPVLDYLQSRVDVSALFGLVY